MAFRWALHHQQSRSSKYLSAYVCRTLYGVSTGENLKFPCSEDQNLAFWLIGLFVCSTLYYRMQFPERKGTGSGFAKWRSTGEGGSTMLCCTYCLFVCAGLPVLTLRSWWSQRLPTRIIVFLRWGLNRWLGHHTVGEKSFICCTLAHLEQTCSTGRASTINLLFPLLFSPGSQWVVAGPKVKYQKDGDDPKREFHTYRWWVPWQNSSMICVRMRVFDVATIMGSISYIGMSTVGLQFQTHHSVRNTGTKFRILEDWAHLGLKLFVPDFLVAA